jgi:DivIVA domain-containing protein
MDLVRELKDVRFELSLRGYDCEAVDAFLAKLRSDIATLQDVNESSAARISELEVAVQDGGGHSETEGTLRRTLLLAQRLADETEVEAKKAASEMVEAATAEAEQMRTSAEMEARSMREEGQRELSNARDEAASIRETTGEEAARTRSESRMGSEQILAEAERRGMERVAVLEQAAQVAAAAMRDPIRTEVSELEAARARVMADIAGLETHLEQQRVRVRTAVEALRAGMSGSIEDLERVAEDDDLLATEPTPQMSGVSADDVTVAPDIEIVETVAAQAPSAPTVDDVEEAVTASGVEATMPTDALIVAEEHVAEVAEEHVAEVAEEHVAEVIDVEVIDVEVIAEEVGLATEAIPLVDAGEPVVVEEPSAGWHADSDTELIELDQEPAALFGTALAVDADTTDVAPPVEEKPTEGAHKLSGTDPQQQASFVDRFAQLLDKLPVRGDE